MGKFLSVRNSLQMLISLASLLSLIGHVSISIRWLMLVCGSGHVVDAYTGGTDSLGAVSSESKTCSEIGVELLKRGVSSNSLDVGTWSN